MKLTLHTDYALRLLMHLSARPDRVCSIPEIARFHAISENHLMKVAQSLVRAGLIASVRGRGGGVRLARPADQITVGEVVRLTEGDCALVDCGGCALSGGCGLTGLLADARLAFLAALDRRTIADVARAQPLAMAV